MAIITSGHGMAGEMTKQSYASGMSLRLGCSSVLELSGERRYGDLSMQLLARRVKVKRQDATRTSNVVI